MSTVEPPAQPQSTVGAIYRRLARNSAYLAGGTAASALFMMLAAVINARALSPRDFGLLVLLQSATMLLGSFMSFSTQQPVIKLGASAQQDGDMPRLGRIIALGLLFDLAAALLAAALGFAVLYFGRGWFGLDGEQVGWAMLFAAALLFTGFQTSNGVFRLLNRFGLLSLIQAGCAAGILVASALLYSASAPFGDYAKAWAAFYALNGLIPLLVALYLARAAGIPITSRIDGFSRQDVATFIAYCWTTWGTSALDTFRSNGDSLLVGAAVSVESAGVYNVAKQLAGVLRKLNTIYASAAFPEISTLSARGEIDGARRVRNRMLWVGGIVGALAVACAILAGRFVLETLFGSRFGEAYLPLVFLTAAAASQLISHTLSMYVQVYAGPEKLFQNYLLAIAIFVVAVVPLTTFFSIVGTAQAQLLFSLALIGLCQLTLGKTALSRGHFAEASASGNGRNQ